MGESQNRQVVLKLYEDFGQGNIQAVLKAFSEDIEFLFQGPDGIPLEKIYKGRSGVEKFFKTLDEILDMQDYSTEDILATGDKVVVLGHERMKVKATGKIYTTRWAHVWTLRNGHVEGFLGYMDSAAIAEAFRS